VNIIASTSVPFTLTTVQVPNLALTHKKWITVCVRPFLSFKYLTGTSHVTDGFWLTCMGNLDINYKGRGFFLLFPLKARTFYIFKNCKTRGAWKNVKSCRVSYLGPDLLILSNLLKSFS
jgi:hypothetical protein